MNNFKKLTNQALAAIFSNLIEQENKVFWIRSSDYKQQLFLSPTYERIWERPAEELYNYPAHWNDYLVGQNPEEFVQLLLARSSNNSETDDNKNNSVLYQIKTPQEEIKFIKDTHFYIFNDVNEQVAVAGFAEVVNENQWRQLIVDCRNQQPDCSLSENKFSLDHILKKELNYVSVPSAHAVLLDPNAQHKPYMTTKNNQKIYLSKREIQCLHHLAQAKTAKQIARELTISPRTVEIHIANIKEKCKCRTTLELITLLKDFCV